MKNIFYYLTTAILLASLGSCEDVINVDLNNAGAQLVIESVIYDTDTSSKVLISKTGDFYNPNAFPVVTGAKVEISDEVINESLKEVSDGIYEASGLEYFSGTTYTLNIESEGQMYTATSVMPEKVNIDSLDYQWAENPRYSGYSVNIYFKDPTEIKNYYRIKIFVNGEIFKDEEMALNNIILWDDKIFNGKAVKLPCKTGGKFFNVNDSVTIRLESLEKGTYDYYNELKNAIAIGSSIIGKSMLEGIAAPANPETNINNNALGFFGAIAVSEKSIVISEH